MMDQTSDVIALKEECISTFNRYIKFLKKGYKPDYSHIINMMCFINSYDKLDNHKSTTKYLMNHAATCLRIR